MSEIETQIEDLLVDWESSRQAGREISVAELCRDCPELAENVGQRIALLKQLSWMDQSEGFDTDHPQVEVDTEIPDSDVTVGEFVRKLTDTGLLSADEIATHVESQEKNVRAYALANELVRKRQITSYQAKVIMERGDSPLLLDRYVILDSIGGGGMGIVFKALQRSLERIVAVKVLPKYAVDSAEKVERFQREMRAAAKLSHPNVVQAFDAHESNGVHFFAMEYVPGRDLSKLVQDEGPLPVDQAVDILSQAAAGLANAHANGIIHRDVKPANILLSDSGVAKVLDLGLALIREFAKTSVTNLTRDGLAMGTVTYMSPEQAFDAKHADERSDIYSLGCTLYFLLHGRPIFDEPNSVQTVVAHRETLPPKLSEGRTDVPNELEALFQSMVAKNPDDRPQSMEQVRTALAEATGQGHVLQSNVLRTKSERRSSRPPSASNQPPKSKRLLTGLLLVTLAMAVAVALVAAVATRPPSPRRLAESLISDEVSLVLSTENAEYQADTLDDFPDEPFAISGVFLYPTAKVRLERFSQIPDLKTLYIVSQSATPESLGELPGREPLLGLEEVSLDGFVVSRDVLTWLSDREKLSYLDLTGCELPADWAQILTRSKSLRELSLVETQTSNKELSTLAKLTQLKFLDVSNTDVTTEGLHHLNSLPLRVLCLTGLELQNEHLQHLAAFTELEELYVDGTNLDDSMTQWIGQLTNLRTLHAGHTELTSAGVRQLVTIPSLQELGVRGIPIQDVVEEIAALSELQHFLADNTDLTDQGLETLSRVRTLQSLYVAGTKVTDSGVERFELRSPSCMVVRNVPEFLVE